MQDPPVGGDLLDDRDHGLPDAVAVHLRPARARMERRHGLGGLGEKGAAGVVRGRLHGA
jgi:hypothetical protein